MPLFTVLIPAYNRGHLIAETIESVFAQGFADIEIVIVDDGSTDNTVAVVRSFGERVRLYEQANRGPGAARNLGIEHARGDYVVFLDSDDLQFSWTLRNYADVIAAHGRPAAVGSREIEFSDRATLSQITDVPPTIQVFADLYAFYAESTPRTFPTGGMAVRTDVLRAVGGFPAERNLNSEDIDLWLRIGEHAGFIYIANPPSYGLRRHATNVSSNSVSNAMGFVEIVMKEHAGKYPGGAARERARLELITFIGRALVVHELNAHQWRWAWRLYRMLLPWNLRLGRYRFIVGLPFVALLEALRLRRQSK